MESAGRLISFDQFRRQVRDAPVSLAGSSHSERTFALTLDGRFFDSIAVNHIVGSDHTVVLHDAAPADGPGGTGAGSSRMVHVQLDGTSTLSQNGRTTLLRPGDLAVYTAAQPFALDHGGESVIFRVPKSELQVPESLIDELVAVRLERERPLVKALSPLVRQLSVDFQTRDPDVGARMVRAAINMLGAVAIETGRHGAQATRRTELDTVLQYIEDNLSHADLTVAEIATANFMSARKLHALFELQDTTVAAWVRSRRLQHCRRELADSAFASLKIAEIAARWGFRDAAHFSHAFADRFGVSPRAFRAGLTQVPWVELSRRTRVQAVRPVSVSPPALVGN